MRLPGMPYRSKNVFKSRITKQTQTVFRGLNHTLGAGDGELWLMQNMTSDQYPLLATRPKRRLETTITTPNGLFSWDGKLCWVDGTKFYYNAVQKGTVANSKKTFVGMGSLIIILPDKAYYDTLTDTFGSLESSWTGTGVEFTNGTLYGEEAERNCIKKTGVTWSNYFKPGDAVTISGCATHPENNKTPVIRAIDGDKLIFYEYVFTLDGTDGETPYTESGSITIERSAPDLLYACENENRLWGSDGRRIYCSKLGDPFNWNVFEGLSTDAWCWPADEAGIVGGITACISFLGYPVFFQENKIFKVYGSLPTNFEVMGSASLGVLKGCERSLAIAGETLFYVSKAGVMAYQGGMPQSVDAALGDWRVTASYWGARPLGAPWGAPVAGSDGLKYYLSATMAQGGHFLLAFDTRRGTWHIEDDAEPVGFAQKGENTYFLNYDGKLWTIGPVRGALANESDFNWAAEFGDFTDGTPNHVGLGKAQIRLELEENATCSVYIKFDGETSWTKMGATLTAGKKRSYYLPIIPRRGDHYRIMLSGTGGCRVYSITRERYEGSELRT